MTNNTYLREVRLKDFRTFGEFTLPVPPGPGLTLLVGTNGLGKSSFFDGIEWCLTGTVRRFQDFVVRFKEGDYLTRRDAVAGSHKVGLTFTEGQPLVRTMREQPTTAALLSLLKDPNWTDIKDVGAYLGFTHFLGQASQQRFTSRDRNDQWQALKGPSGIERLESIRTALRGRATTMAFNRRQERDDARVSAAVAALQDWQAKVARLAELAARGLAAGAETEATLSARLLTIEQSLNAGQRAPQDFSARLSAARASIETQQREVAQHLAGIDGLRALLTRFADSVALTDPDGGRIASADAAVARETAAVSEATLAATKSGHAAADQAAAVARAQSQLDECIRVRAAIAEYGALGVELQAAQAEQAALQAQRSACQADLTSAHDALTRARQAQATLVRLDREQETLQRWYTRAAGLQGLESTAQTLRATASAAIAAAANGRARVAGLERDFENARSDEKTAEERLATRRRDASQLTALLSGLAAHIRHDDTNCPVCASSFPAGELQTRALSALAAQDVQLAEDVRALEVLRDRTKGSAQALTEVQALFTAESAAMSAAEAANTAAAIERSAIAAGLEVVAASDLASLIAARLTDAARVRAAHLRDTNGTATGITSAQTRVETLSALQASLDERLATATQRHARCDATLRSIEETLSAYPRPWSIEAADAAREAQSKLVEAARANLEVLTLARAAATNLEAAARERLLAAKAEHERTASAIRQGATARAAAADSWQKAGMTGEPSSQAIEARQAELLTRAGALAARLEETNAMSRHHEAFLAHDELRKLRGLMEQQGGQGAADNPAPCEQQLQNRLQAARESAGLTQAARAAVLAYGEQLKTEAESFSTKFLMPLNDLIDGFNRAMLSDPGAAVQFNAEHTVERTSVAMQLRYADPVDNAQYKTTLPPQVVLSEGQMAANGFSILCAASTAYRWSRWRALLLDDPLQHNDVIHAAAFVDVMRNLVELEGYQLLMSSHRRDEGEFIARKFDAAGLPCTLVELVGTSKDGVRVGPPRHNPAARRLLTEPAARLA